MGFYGDGVASIEQAVHDGDTVNVRLTENLAIRFFGIDTPEISLTFPKPAPEPEGDRPNFISLNNDKWEAFLSDPFDCRWKPFDTPLEAGAADASGVKGRLWRRGEPPQAGLLSGGCA